MKLPPPLSLYVHTPWCVRKCPYCDFNSHEKRDDFNEYAYVQTLLTDLTQTARLTSREQLGSIFFGGGTPSLFSAESFKAVISLASSLFTTSDIEITLEANPGTFEQEKFSAYREAGINRLSIGVQSFDSHFLSVLGRIHDGEQSCSAIETARKAGFDNINLDIMFGLPGQTTDQAIQDIIIATRQDVSHISHYQLTLEPNTYFHSNPPELPDIDTLWAMQTSCQSTLNMAGFEQYEVSAYSKPGMQSRHNLNYWLFGDYIGIGAGAHSKLSNPPTGEITRYWKHRQPNSYMTNIHNNIAFSGEKIITDDCIPFEFLLNTLRLKDGCSAALFQQRTGRSLEQLKTACRLIDSDLLKIDSQQICTTEKGFLFLNDILEKLL